MMAEANREFFAGVKTDWHDPRFPIYCNVIGKAARSGAELWKHWQTDGFPCLVGGNNSLHVGGRSAQIYGK